MLAWRTRYKKINDIAKTGAISKFSLLALKQYGLGSGERYNDLLKRSDDNDCTPR